MRLDRFAYRTGLLWLSVKAAADIVATFYRGAITVLTDLIRFGLLAAVAYWLCEKFGPLLAL